MSISTTIAALQALHAEVAGVQSAPLAYPASMVPSELPCVLVYTGPGVMEWESHGGDLVLDGQTYLCRWFIQSVAVGSVDEGMQQAIVMLDRAKTLYRVTDRLSNTAEVVMSAGDGQQAIRNSGVRSDLVYGDAGPFRGFEVQVSIVERIE